MPSFNVDFSDVQDFEPLAAGRYTLRVTSVEVTQSAGGKAPGTPMLKMQYTVVGGDHDGRRIFDNLMLKGDALWRTKLCFKALLSDSEGGNIDTEDLMEQECDVFLKQDVWKEEAGGDGSVRNRIGRFIIPTGDSVEPLAGSATKRLFGRA